VILSAGLTPAWQQVLVFDRFRPGEVNRAAAVRWCAQGKVINAGIAAHHLGGASLTLAPLGGPAAEAIDGELRALGVPRRWIPTQAHTRVCTTILDRASGTMTELVEDGRPLTDQELEMYRQCYREEIARAKAVIVMGSLPTGTPPSFYRDLLEQTSCPAVLDFRGNGLLGVLDLEPMAVKPNREELGRTVGRDLSDDHDLVAAMRSLNDRGARWVAITQGSGPVWLSSRTELYRLTPPKVARVVNPIGCGDAMSAGIAHASCQGMPIVDAVRYGVAASADNLGDLLTCRLDPKRIASWCEQVEVQRVE